jgi:hypothetical protein
MRRIGLGVMNVVVLTFIGVGVSLAQDGERLGLERYDLLASPQLLVHRIEPKRRKENHSASQLVGDVYRTFTACS